MERNNQYEYIDKEYGGFVLCILCKRPLENPRRTQCNHIFCRECLIRWMRTNTNSCPACRKFISIDGLSQISGVLQNMLDQINVRCTLCRQENIPKGNFNDHSC